MFAYFKGIFTMMKSVQLNNRQIGKFISNTEHLRHEKPHQYEKIRIHDGKIVLILYNSGKLVYEDNPHCNSIINPLVSKKSHDDRKDNTQKKSIKGHKTKARYYKNKQNYEQYNDISLSDYEYTIGSDETGKGEWFGPLVVTAVSTSKDENIKLREMGVKDSKKLDKKQITQLYHKIEELGIRHESIVLKPFSYNKLYNKFKSEGKNLNHLLAYLHTKLIKMLLEDTPSNDLLIIIDKFDIKKTNEYLNNNSLNVIQTENGERYTPVAAASIIAKYKYEKALHELEKRYNVKLNKKAKTSKIDKDILEKVAKTHFKNIKRYL